LTLSDDGSGKGAALIAIVADRFQRSQLRSISSFDDNDDDVDTQQTVVNSRSTTQKLIRTLP